MLNAITQKSLVATALTLSILCSGRAFADTDEPVYQYGPFYSYPNEQKNEKPVASGKNSSWSGMSYPANGQSRKEQPKKSPPNEYANDCKTGEEWKKTDTQRTYGPFYSYPEFWEQKAGSSPTA